MNPSQLNHLILEAVADVRNGLTVLRDSSQAAAETDQQWRSARARAYAMTSGTVAERDAAVEVETGHLRYAAKLAEDLRVSALEAVRSHRAILSAVQSMAAMARSEAELLKYADVNP